MDEEGVLLLSGKLINCRKGGSAPQVLIL